VNYYYLRPDIRYGSESLFDPYWVWINGSFDIMRNGVHDKDIFAHPWGHSFENVSWNLLHPLQAIEDYGVDAFIEREIGNLSTEVKKAQFAPNFALHAIGNGMKYKKLAEYYQYHGKSWPHLRSLLVSYSYHFVNELVENEYWSGANVDPISDLYIFNPLGIALYSWPAFNRFMSGTLHLSDWSLQPYYDPFSRYLENTGQQWMARYYLNEEKGRALFSYFGVDVILGYSWTSRRDSDASWSFGAGAGVNRLIETRTELSRVMLPEIDYEMGLFYDREKSLLFSAIVTGPRFFNIRLNAYPGLIRIRDWEPGFHLAFGESDAFMAGITLQRLPVGLGYRDTRAIRRLLAEHKIEWRKRFYD